jgi:hypothetical protein
MPPRLNHKVDLSLEDKSDLKLLASIYETEIIRSGEALQNHPQSQQGTP